MQMELKTKVWTTSPASLELWLFLAKPVVEGSRVCNDGVYGQRTIRAIDARLLWCL
jgi:hypothetical protein